MKTPITTTAKSIVVIMLLMMSIGSFAKSTNKATNKGSKAKEVKVQHPKKSLHYYMGIDGKKHYVRAAKSGVVMIEKDDIAQKEWYTMMAFTKKSETLGYFNPEGKNAFIVVELISAKH